MTANPTSQFNGCWLTIDVVIPVGYTAPQSGWWKIKYNMSGSRDLERRHDLEGPDPGQPGPPDRPLTDMGHHPAPSRTRTKPPEPTGGFVSSGADRGASPHRGKAAERSPFLRCAMTRARRTWTQPMGRALGEPGRALPILTSLVGLVPGTTGTPALQPEAHFVELQPSQGERIPMGPRRPPVRGTSIIVDDARTPGAARAPGPRRRPDARPVRRQHLRPDRDHGDRRRRELVLGKQPAGPARRRRGRPGRRRLAARVRRVPPTPPRAPRRPRTATRTGRRGHGLPDPGRRQRPTPRRDDQCARSTRSS